MKQILAIAAIAITLTAVSPELGHGQSREPSYLILRAPERGHKGHAYYRGRGYAVRTQTYAYGWFGAKPRRHYRRSTGYYDSYIQWTKQ